MTAPPYYSTTEREEQEQEQKKKTETNKLLSHGTHAVMYDM